MEIIGATIGLVLALVLPPEITASPNNSPYELVQEYQTNQECQIAILNSNDICMTEPEIYSGTRQYSKVSKMREKSLAVKLEPNAISGIDRNVCNHISGCAVDPSAMTEEEYCPTCSQSKWYLMND
jgi:hypothetical protein|tara:strand:+ start:5002 stop:5379 length:378 start_codon:yes stop_codon:yes gene_type:complete